MFKKAKKDDKPQTRFDQTKAYRNLTLDDIYELTEEESWEILRKARWGAGEETECPCCNHRAKHYFIRTRKQWRCKECQHFFSVTSGTPFSSHKISFRQILRRLFHFITAPQGQSANSLHSKIGATCKTVWLGDSKIREALFETQDLTKLKGVVMIDAGFFCGKPRNQAFKQKADANAINSKLKNWKGSINPTRNFAYAANPEKKENRRIMISFVECNTDEWDSNGTKRVITVIAKTLKSVDMNKLIHKYVDPKALLMTDSGTEFSRVGLECPNTHFQVNHSKGYTTEDGVNNNQAETMISRLRRAEIGTYNGMRPQYFAFYAAEFAWRSNVSKMSLKEKFQDALTRIMSCGISLAFCGYNQGRRLIREYVIN